MSIAFKFTNNQFCLDALHLPTRHYYFSEQENYIKLLNIGEGIFPKDKQRISCTLSNSNLILTTESATKVYPSKKEYGINKINIHLNNESNLEFINDELILYKDSKYIQLFTLAFDESSTFFYSDILSRGRSFEDFDFSNMLMKNSFKLNHQVEYLEKFDVTGEALKTYVKRKKSENYLFAKVYMKTKNNEKFLKILQQNRYESMSETQHKKIIVGVLTSNNMGNLKEQIMCIWDLYRQESNKKQFILGKQ